MYKPQTVTITLLDEARTAGLQLGAEERPGEEDRRAHAGGQGRRRGRDGGAAPGRRADRLQLAMTLGLQLGRPGIYRQDVRDPPRLRGVRLDVAGFVGVALRGPGERADAGGQLGRLRAPVRRLRAPTSRAGTGCCRTRCRRSSPRAAYGPGWSGWWRSTGRVGADGGGGHGPVRPRCGRRAGSWSRPTRAPGARSCGSGWSSW